MNGDQVQGLQLCDISKMRDRLPVCSVLMYAAINCLLTESRYAIKDVKRKQEFPSLLANSPKTCYLQGRDYHVGVPCNQVCYHAAAACESIHSVEGVKRQR